MPQANKPDYDPSRPPQFPAGSDADTLSHWVNREIHALAISMLDKTAVELRPINAPPPKPREGMIVYADGTNWNPTGHGKGPYVFAYGLWVPMLPLTSPPVTVTGTTYSIVPSDDVVVVNSAVPVTITLQPPAQRPGRQLVVKSLQNVTVSSASANVIPLQGTVPGTLIIPAAGRNAWVRMSSDGTNWVVIEGA